MGHKYRSIILVLGIYEYAVFMLREYISFIGYIIPYLSLNNPHAFTTNIFINKYDFFIGFWNYSRNVPFLFCFLFYISKKLIDLQKYFNNIDFHLLSIDNLRTVKEQTVSTGNCLSWNRFFKPEICYGHTVLLC